MIPTGRNPMAFIGRVFEKKCIIGLLISSNVWLIFLDRSPSAEIVINKWPRPSAAELLFSC